jgi:hypothetical protein
MKPFLLFTLKSVETMCLNTYVTSKIRQMEWHKCLGTSLHPSVFSNYKINKHSIYFDNRWLNFDKI